MIKESITKLIDKKDLTRGEIQSIMEEIMTGQATPAQIASFLTALRLKGETIDEITGAAAVMRKFAAPIRVKKDVIFDSCGTGGDCRDTFNVSTISAFVVAGCGVTVAKHGNRSVSSRCGSADLLEALGVTITMSREKIEQCLNDIGIAFLFAPNLHPAMKYAAPVRKEIGIRTIFNILGPLTNPAGATHQLLGVYDEGLTQTLAAVLKNLGTCHALVVHGSDGLDEITTTGPSLVSELKDGQVQSYQIFPEELGIKQAASADLKGADVSINVRCAREIFDGRPGPKRDIVLLNAACALYAADKTPNIKEALILAKQSIDFGKAKEKLNLLCAFSKNLG